MESSFLNTRPKVLYMAMGVALGTLCAGPAWAQEPEYDEDQPVLEEVVVTGSRIQRSTNTVSQEILTYTFEDIQLSGDVSVADALRSSTMNSFGSFPESSGMAWQSNAVLDLRGVGIGRNLVLLNGRRTVGSPSLFGSGAVNLNMLPFSAVDRIEVIADGASAVYGSDAVAGVTNVILKKNYQGIIVQARYGDRTEDDGTEESASVLIGASGERGNITFSLEYDKRDPIFDADREYTSAKWGDYDGDGVIVGWQETVGVSPYGYTLRNPSWDRDVPYDPNNQDTWFVTPGAGCIDNTGEGGGFVGALSAEDIFGPGSGFYCGYAYSLVSANRAGLERINNFVSAEYQLSDSASLFVDVLMASNESFGRWAPSVWKGPPVPGDPRNDIGATQGWFRFTEIGTRDGNVTDILLDINIGARGELDGSASWEAYYTYSDYVSKNVGNYYPSYAGFSYNVSQEIDDYQQYVANMKATTLLDDRQKLQKAFVGMQFDVFRLPGGVVSAYTGAEYFTVDYAALVDAQMEAGLIGGSGFGPSVRGSRDVVALFAEAVIPVLENWEIDLAIRYDDYSDFGSTTTPRIGTIFWFPSYDVLRFKASWGEGFRAPDLSSLYGRTETSYPVLTDLYGCQLNDISEEDCWQRRTPIETHSGSNPDLDAESSKSLSVGADWRFADRWQASINYFHLELDDMQVFKNPEYELELDYLSGGNNEKVQRNELGWADLIDARWYNASVPLSFDSVDFALNGGFDSSIGDFGIQAHASHYIRVEWDPLGTGDTENVAGYRYHPDWRANILLSWNLHDAFASINWDYTAAQKSEEGAFKNDPWYTFNVQAGYDFGRNGTVTLGANNVLNREPKTDENGLPLDLNVRLQDLTGRVIYLSYRVER